MAHDFDREAARRRKNRKRSPRTAPGELETVQAFVNTKDMKKRADELSTPRELAAWLARRKLSTASAVLTADDLDRARHAREGIRALLRANNGVELDEAAVARLDEAARGARIEVRFDRDGTVRFEAASPDFPDVLGGLLGLVAAARLRDDWPRFKACMNGGCQAAFWDSMRTGKWCSHRCGDLMRAKAHRRTQKYKRSSRR